MTVATLMAASCSAGAVLAVLLALNSGLLDLTPPGQPDALAALNAQTTGESDPSAETETESGKSLESAIADAATAHAMDAVEDGVASARQHAGNWLITLNAQLGGSLTGLSNDWHGLEPRLKSALAGVAALGGLFGFRWTRRMATVQRDRHRRRGLRSRPDRKPHLLPIPHRRRSRPAVRVQARHLARSLDRSRRLRGPHPVADRKKKHRP